MNYTELATKIRDKHPGAYDDLDDEALAQKVVAKYPQYSDVTFDKPKSGFMGKLASLVGRLSFLGNPLGEVGSRVAKGAVEDPRGTAAQALEFAPAAGAMAVPAAVGAVTGGVGLPAGIALAGAGGAAGEKARQIGREVLGLPSETQKKVPIPFTNINFPDVPGVSKNTSNMIVEGGTQAAFAGLAPLVQKAGEFLRGPAVSAARRSLGFQKSQLSSTKSPFETMRKTAQANKASEAMLERGEIPLSGSADTMQENALKILAKGRGKVSTAIDAIEKGTPKVVESEIDDALLKGLDPKNQAELNTALTIRRDIADRLVKGELGVKELNDLRSAWGKSGFQDKTVGSEAANMYRKAWKVAGDKIKALADAVSPEIGTAYKSGLKDEEIAMNAMRGIQNRIAGDQGNAALSLPALTTSLQKRAFAPISNALNIASNAAQGVSGSIGLFSQIIANARARLNDQGKDLKPVQDGGKSEKVNGKSLTDFVRKAKLGTQFTYQGQKFKVVPQPGRDKKDLAKMSAEERRVYESSKSRFRGANTFSRA